MALTTVRRGTAPPASVSIAPSARTPGVLAGSTAASASRFNDRKC